MPNFSTDHMIYLLEESRFQEVIEKLIAQTHQFAIYNILLNILRRNKIEIDGESFDARQYQEEFSEGLAIYKALEKSNIDKHQFNEYLAILVKLAFKMCSFIQLMASTAMNKGVYLSDIEEIYKVKPEIREKLQDFIDILKKSEGMEKHIANLAAGKAKVSNSIDNLLHKYQIGEDMLQFAKSYEIVGQADMATKIYQDIMNDFEAESVKLSSGLFPEISQIDTRSKNEIDIFEKAKTQFEELTGRKIPEVKRVHVDDSEVAKKVVSTDFTEIKPDSKGGFIGNIFKRFGKK